MLPEEDGVFNLDGALEFMDGDRELLGDLIDQFLDDAPRLLMELEKAITDHNARGVERTAHTLKGSLSVFSARLAAEAAYELEKLGRAGKLDLAASASRKLEEEIERLKPALAEARQS